MKGLARTDCREIADYRKAALWYLDDAPRATLVIESTSKEDAADLFDIITVLWT